MESKSEKIKQILEQVDPDQNVLTDDVIGKFQNLVEERADEKADEKLEEKRQEIWNQALEQVDKDHTEKLENLTEAIDEDHAKKLEQVKEQIDEDHAKKFEEAVQKIDEDHAQKLEEAVEAVKKSKIDENVVGTVSDFLDSYLEESMPEQKQIDEAKLKAYDKLFEDLRKKLMVTDDYVQGEVKEAIEEGKTKMDEQEEKINNLMLEKTKLEKQLKEKEAQEALDDKVEHLTEDEAGYVRKQFEDVSDANQITEESVQEAVAAYKKGKRQKKSKDSSREDKKNYRGFINESKKDNGDNPNDEDGLNNQEMDMYTKMLNKSM